jgi:hypothetical protein
MENEKLGQVEKIGDYYYVNSNFNLKEPIRSYQPERSKREDVEKYGGPSHQPDEGWPSKNRFP